MELKYPSPDRVVIRPIQDPQKTRGGIIIPDMAQKKPQLGTIVINGPGTMQDPTALKKGDKVLYNKHRGTDIVMEGEKLVSVREEDVILIYR